MSHLDDLPNELLLQIALSLQGSRSDSNHDAYNLALVARKFRSISQEALHTYVSVRMIRRVEPKPYRVGYLARTLMERPDLARKVKELDLALMWKIYSHEEACNAPTERCTCYWDDMKNLCVDFLNTTELWNETWVEAIEGGFEEAIAGVVLHLLPALHILNIDNYRQTKYLDINGNIALVPRRIDTYYLFGVMVQEFLPSLVPGLANLKHIRSSAQIPWQLINLPSLETLHIGILPTILNYPFASSLSPSTAFNITSLTIPMNIVVLESDYLDDIDGGDAYIHFSEKFCEGLTQLKHLSIQLYRKCETRGSRLGDHKIAPPGSSNYGELFSNLYSSSLETIVLDTSDVDVRAVKDWKSGQKYLESCNDPLASLKQFPNLKTIIAPQQAFFTSRSQSLSPILYPPSLRSIGIIDPSFDISDYISLLGRFKYAHTPKLTMVEFWCDHNRPLISVHSSCDRTATNLNRDGTVEFRRGSFFSELNSLEEVGVSVITNQEPRGWRSTQGLRGKCRYELKKGDWGPMRS